jgi:hypothetical protein
MQVWVCVSVFLALFSVNEIRNHLNVIEGAILLMEPIAQLVNV